MALQSAILSGNARLEKAASTGPSVKAGPPDDPDAIRRIQKALVALGFSLPRSFPKGPGGEPDGIYGSETATAVSGFQKRVFPGMPSEWDGRAGPKTLGKMDALLPKGGGPAPGPPAPTVDSFICGPDVTDQVVKIWSQIQRDFAVLPRMQKIKACNTIFIPIKRPDSPDNTGIPTDLESLKQKLQLYADVDGWDTLPLYQGNSEWLRTPPVFDPKTNGPCATPPGTPTNPTDPFDDGWEDPDTCSDTVQVAGKCWLNGTVNYGTFGIMVRLCRDFAATDTILRFLPAAKTLYSLEWATMLIRAYKRFGQHPEDAILPIAWTEATYYRGPAGTPTAAGNRPKCKCKCGCKGDVTTWDYIWEPIKPRDKPNR